MRGSPEPVSVENAVWLKKGYGNSYTWTILVAADSNSSTDLEVAADRAVEVAEKLERFYGQNGKARKPDEEDE